MNISSQKFDTAENEPSTLARIGICFAAKMRSALRNAFCAPKMHLSPPSFATVAGEVLITARGGILSGGRGFVCLFDIPVRWSQATWTYHRQGGQT